MVALTEDADPLARAWRTAWSPPDRRHNYEWATDEVHLAGDYAQTGRFAIRDSKYLVKPFECLDDDRVRMLNILKAPRTGGSLVGDIWIQDLFKNKPGPTMATFQSDDDAERHFLTKIEPTFKATKANAELFAEMKKKRELYQFPHMNFYFQGANPNNLQGKGIKYEWNDEVWMWKAGLINQAFMRTEDFKRVCKILNISQGGVINSEWETVYNRGKRHDYAVRCEACGKLQPLEFFAHRHDNPRERAGIVWEKTARLPDGRWNIVRAAETTRFRCMYCGHDHVDEGRTYEKFAASADYICHDPDRPARNVSLRWNAMVGGDWWRLTEKFLQACEVRDFSGSTIGLEDFYKKDLATFWDPSLAVEKVVVSTSDYHMEPVSAKDYKSEAFEWEANRFLVADYQQGNRGDTRHLLVVARVWSDELRNRSRLLWWGRVNTFAQLYQLQRSLQISSPCVAVDGGFEMMEVATQCAKYGWTMLIGDDPEFFLHKRKKGPPRRRPFSPLFKTDPLKGKAGQGRSFCYTMFWSNPAIKNLLWNLRHGLTRHKWEIPADIPPEYRDGIDSEVKQWVVKKGSAVPEPRWVPIKAYNHPWDIECMQTVLAVVAGCLTFDVEEDQPRPAPDGAGEKKDDAKKKEEIAAPHDQPDQLELLPR